MFFIFIFPDMKEEYDIGPMDVLRYLKDHTDVRTRHSAYGKSQTIAAVRATIAAHSQEMDPCVLLFRVNLYLVLWFPIHYMNYYSALGFRQRATKIIFSLPGILES